MNETAFLGRDVQRITSAVAHWTPARWRIPAPDGGDRAEAVVHLIQTLADLAAAAENHPARRVPRPLHDTALSDQLRVVGNDLATANPDATLAAAAHEALARARAVLF